jgi:DNA-binding LytR/AlgR family response regulator
VFQVGDTRPFLIALPSELQANWLLLVFCIFAFGGLAQIASRFAPPREVHAARACLPAYVMTIPVKAGTRSLQIALDDVDWIETQGNYLALHTGTATHLIRETLVAFEAKLDPSAFVRIHRRTLVALSRVRGIEPLGNGDALVRLGDDITLRMSRSYRQKLRSALAATQNTAANS